MRNEGEEREREGGKEGKREGGREKRRVLEGQRTIISNRKPIYTFLQLRS